MGSEDTLNAVRARRTSTHPFLGFGSRHSVAWWTDPDQAEAVALDALAYDGRGCMTPTAIYTPIEDGPELLAAAMKRIKVRFPTGRVYPAEAAFLRRRKMLANVTGRVVGDVLVLPPHLADATPTPGMATLHHGPMPELDPNAISCVGTDGGPVPNIRTVPLGTMQAPDLDRTHDGVRWTRWPER